MASPTVTHSQAASLTEHETVGPVKLETAVQWAKWLVLGSIVIGVGLLVAALVVTITNRKRTEESQAKWDEVYNAIHALKDDAKPADQIAALESVAPKVNNSAAHAYVLMKLGNMYFEDAMRPEKFKDERDAALKKAISLYDVVANNEPYKSNPSFGPLATQNLALAQEQAKDYKSAIDTLNNALNSGALDSHYLYHEMLFNLGRIYWLQSEDKKTQAADATKEEDKKRLTEESEQDRKLARSKISDALRSSALKGEHSDWSKEAEYIKSLVYDKPGSGLPDGKIPAPKPPKPAAMPGMQTLPNGNRPPKMNFNLPPRPGNGAPPAINVVPSPGPGAPASATKSVTPEKLNIKPPSAVPPAAKPDEKKPDDKKADEKKDKQSSLSLPPSEEEAIQADASAPNPSGHLSFSQMQQLLKAGKSPFCQCPRCLSAQKSPASKLVE